jgi:hypothetical protein
MNEETENESGTTTIHPLWKAVAKGLIKDGISYGQEWDVEWFERNLRCPRDSKDFAFAMMSLRGLIEEDVGVYIRERDNGKKFYIPPAPEHEDIATGFDRKVRRFAVRSVNLRSATLMNPLAQLSDSERSKMERNLEHASMRLVLMARAKSVSDCVRQHNPKLLEKK